MPVSAGAVDFCSRCSTMWSATKVRSNRARAGTSFAGMAVSSGRNSGATMSELPECRRISAFQLPCTGIGSVVR